MGTKLDSSYNVINDEIYKTFADDKKNNTEKTMKEYRKTLNKFCKAIGKPLSEIVEELKMEQTIITEEIISQDKNKIISRKIEFNVDDPNTTIKKYHKQFESYCLERGNKPDTANKHIQRVRGFFKANNIKLPKWEFLKEEPPKWELLEKEDIKFVLDECSIIHKSLILFMISSGMRIGDCVELTIGDFMDATRAYHDYVDAEDFVDNAPQDMMGYWSFEPGKTKKFNVKCKTFNSPESSNIILQNLRRLKNEYFPKKRKRLEKKLKDETDPELIKKLKEDIEKLKISKTNALFGSRDGLYIRKMKPESIGTLFPAKNKKLYEWRINKIKKAIEDGEISAEDYEREVNKIPRFHAHACRKYFETMISRNTGDLRIATLMEGHTSPVKTDPHYIKKEFDEVQEIYLQAIEDLTIENVDSKLLSNKKISELESTIKSLTSDQEEKDQIIKQQEEEINNLRKSHNSLDNTVEDLSERLKEMDKQLKHLNNNEQGNLEIRNSINIFVWYLISKTSTSEDDKFLKEMKLDIEALSLNLNNDEREEIYNSKTGKQLRTYMGDEISTIEEIAYEIASKDMKFNCTIDYLDKLIKKSILKLKRNPDLVIKVKNYHEKGYENILAYKKFMDLFKDITNELNLWDEEELVELKGKIMETTLQNGQYTEDEITKEFVTEWIEEYM